MTRNELATNAGKLGCSVEIDLNDGRNKTVRITAPSGYNFGGNHEEVTTFLSGTSAELYQEAWNNLSKAILGIQKCDPETCGSWMGFCEYWGEE